MSIDPRIAVALSVQARKGVYALLLGSGVSRAANIPTGWEVVTDLIGKIAVAEGAPQPEEPAEWYRSKYRAEPTYSSLLAAVAPSRADRSHRLRGYFEPSDEQRAQGERVPTKAHRAIAKLVRAGFVKVIVTTNFDRLIEQALEGEGMSPSVIASEAAAEGMTPLHLADCTVVKVNGDYLDLETRNTGEELAAYGPELSTLLRQILTEYGLIICGWSAEWDTALRNAIVASTRHRFATYWTTRGHLSGRSKEVAAARSAVAIEIEAADQFFEDLETRVTALEDGRLADPLSGPIAARTVKRLLSKPEFRIQLGEAVERELARVRMALSGSDVTNTSIQPNNETIRTRVERFEAIITTLTNMLFAGCRWGESEHDALWIRCIERLAPARPWSGLAVWSELQSVPLSYAFYAAGMGAIEAGRYATLNDLLTRTWIQSEYEGRQRIARIAGARVAFAYKAADALIVLGENRTHKTAASEWLHKRLGTMLKAELPDSEQFTLLFHRFEALLSMAVADLGIIDASSKMRVDLIPDGRYAWHESKPLATLELVNDELGTYSTEWPPLKGGMFGGEYGRAAAAREAVVKLTSRLRMW